LHINEHEGICEGEIEHWNTKFEWKPRAPHDCAKETTSWILRSKVIKNECKLLSYRFIALIELKRLPSLSWETVFFKLWVEV
jgi:hypothetical protein